METQFEVVTFLDEQKLTEFYRYTSRKRLVGVWICVAFGIAFLIWGIIRLYLNMFIFTAASMAPLAGAVLEFTMAIRNYRLPWRVAKKEIKKDRQFSGKEQPFSLTKFSDQIYDEDTNRTNIVPYDKVKQIHISANLVAMIDIRDFGIVIDKNGFRKGTYEDFLKFIQAKCPQAKITVS